jgi:PBP1b-binding outer membrane lipoprotein LpoB
LAELNFLKTVYKDQYAQVQPINDPNFLVYEHVMCNTVVTQGKFSQAKWKNPENHIQKLETE